VFQTETGNAGTFRQVSARSICDDGGAVRTTCYLHHHTKAPQL